MTYWLNIKESVYKFVTIDTQIAEIAMAMF